MKKFFILSIFLYYFLGTSNVSANLEKGKWSFVKDDTYCFIGSMPTILDLPEGKIRGDVYILVYRLNKNPETIVQINSGYPYKENEPVNVKIDKIDYKFWSDDDSAFTDNDSEVVDAMKKGLELVITGESSRGTITNDTYTLKGFTSAFNQLTKDC